MASPSKTTITIEYKKEKKEGTNFPPSVLSTDKVWYSIPQVIWDKANVGDQYDVDYLTNAKGYHSITAAKLVKKAEPQKANGPMPAASYRQRTAPEESEQMWVCALMEATIQALGDRFNAEEDEAVGLVNMWRNAYARTFGGKPSAKDEMGDEIPYDR